MKYIKHKFCRTWEQAKLPYWNAAIFRKNIIHYDRRRIDNGYTPSRRIIINERIINEICVRIKAVNRTAIAPQIPTEFW